VLADESSVETGSLPLLLVGAGERRSRDRADRYCAALVGCDPVGMLGAMLGTALGPVFTTPVYSTVPSAARSSTRVLGWIGSVSVIFSFNASLSTNAVWVVTGSPLTYTVAPLGMDC